MTTLSQATDRILARCRELALVTDVLGETTRTYLSPAMHRANALVAGWMREAGLSPAQDAAGNLSASSGAARPRLLLGSHLDTVRNAGAFDGPLGVLLALEAVVLCPGLPYDVEVIAFAEEEGVRFHQPFLGSRALTGELAPLLHLTDDDGIALGEALPLPDALETARLHPLTFAYLEAHIEQGPVLESEGRSLAAVSAIAGQSRLRMHFAGTPNHAGTTPMRLRHDALAAAAQLILFAEQLASETAGLVATVGSCTVAPGVGNVVPGEVTLLLDIRHADDSVRRHSLAECLHHAQSSAERRGVLWTHTILLDQPAVAMHAELTAEVATAAQRAGYDASPLLSGAGHDAMILAPHVPSAMLFVRTPGGLSHHPAEAVSPRDVQAALETLLQLLPSLNPASYRR